jgi:hypothetical protein
MQLVFWITSTTEFLSITLIGYNKLDINGFGILLSKTKKQRIYNFSAHSFHEIQNVNVDLRTSISRK